MSCRNRTKIDADLDNVIKPMLLIVPILVYAIDVRVCSMVYNIDLKEYTKEVATFQSR